MELEILKLDPISIQNTLLSFMGEEELNLVDPTSPLIKFIEAESITTSNIISEITSMERRLFPGIARTMKDLYPHFISGDEKDIFFSPSEATFRMMIDVDTILSNAIVLDNVYKFTIPRESYINVDNTKFLIVNDVNITLNNKGGIFNSFVELVNNNNNVEFKSIGNLQSSILSDSKGVLWLNFDLPTKQLDYIEVESRLISSVEFVKEQEFKDGFYYVEVISKDMSDVEIILDKIFSDTYLDLSAPTSFIQVLDNKIRVAVNESYINRLIKGFIKLRIYSTKGKLRIDLNKFNLKDFEFTISGISDTVEKSVSSKMNYLVYSNNIVDGGNNTRPLKDIKKKIINRVNGGINNPITEFHLNEHSKKFGFTIKKVSDLITSRLFIANRDINDLETTSSVPTTYIMNNRTTLEGGAFDQDGKIVIGELLTLIKPGSLFEDINGNIRPLDSNTLYNINDSTTIEKSKILNSKSIFFTPFLYIIKNDIGSTTSRIYDIEDCNMDYLNIISKNENVNINVDISEYKIFRVGDGYDIYFEIFGNNDFENIKDSIGIQIEIPGRTNKIYFHSEKDIGKIYGVYGDTEKNIIYVRIDSNLNIDEENFIHLENGYSSSGVNEIELSTTMNIVIYTTNLNTISSVSSSGLIEDYLSIDDIQGTDQEVIGLTRETIDIRLGTELTHLWNRADNLYSKNKYMRYETDIIARYKSDVYVKSNNQIINFTEDDGCRMTTELAHKKGDIIYNDGSIVYEKNKGDIIYDANDQVIIDYKYGILRFLDILMLEYNYIAFSKPSHIEHIDYTVRIIRNWLKRDLVEMNKVCLEQTSIAYMPKRNNDLIIDSNGLRFNKRISPKVIIYYSDDVHNEDLENNKHVVGKILNRFFSKKYINLKDVESEILNTLFPNALEAKIEGVMNDTKIINLDKSSNRLEMKKKIDDNFNVVYDFDLIKEVL